MSPQERELHFALMSVLYYNIFIIFNKLSYYYDKSIYMFTDQTAQMKSLRIVHQLKTLHQLKMDKIHQAREYGIDT